MMKITAILNSFAAGLGSGFQYPAFHFKMHLRAQFLEDVCPGRVSGFLVGRSRSMLGIVVANLCRYLYSPHYCGVWASPR